MGVIEGKIESGENLNFAIPADAVVRLLNAPVSRAVPLPVAAKRPAPSSGSNTVPRATRFERALVAFENKQYAVAAQLFEQEVASKPAESEAAFNAGLANAQLGRMGRAVDYFQEFLDIATPGDKGIPLAKKWIAAYAAALAPDERPQRTTAPPPSPTPAVTGNWIPTGASGPPAKTCYRPLTIDTDAWNRMNASQQAAACAAK